MLFELKKLTLNNKKNITVTVAINHIHHNCLEQTQTLIQLPSNQ